MDVIYTNVRESVFGRFFLLLLLFYFFCGYIFLGSVGLYRLLLEGNANTLNIVSIVIVAPVVLLIFAWPVALVFSLSAAIAFVSVAYASNRRSGFSYKAASYFLGLFIASSYTLIIIKYFYWMPLSGHIFWVILPTWGSMCIVNWALYGLNLNLGDPKNRSG